MAPMKTFQRGAKGLGMFLVEGWSFTKVEGKCDPCHENAFTLASLEEEKRSS